MGFGVGVGEGVGVVEGSIGIIVGGALTAAGGFPIGASVAVVVLENLTVGTLVLSLCDILLGSESVGFCLETDGNNMPGFRSLVLGGGTNLGGGGGGAFVTERGTAAGFCLTGASATLGLRGVVGTGRG